MTGWIHPLCSHWSSNQFSSMPINSPFRMAPDARKKTGGDNSSIASPLCPVSPLKFQPFSRFHSVSLIPSSAHQSHSVSLPLQCLNKLPEPCYIVPIHQSSSVLLPVAPITPLPLLNALPSPNTSTPPSSNTHHSHFASAFSNPTPSHVTVPFTSNSHISKLLTPSPL